MISLQVAGRNFELTDKVEEYIEDKIGGLDRYLPQVAKQSQGRITLTSDPSGKQDNKCVCEVVISVPGTTLQAREATINMFAAIDIAEAKLRAQIETYKSKVVDGGRRGRPDKVFAAPAEEVQLAAETEA